jgi:hypothetical protein
MDDHADASISSAEFRRTYAKLRRPTSVTANGHLIGQWIPANSATYAIAKMGDEYTVHGLRPPRGVEARPAQAGDPTFRFGEPRPAPKPGQKR